MRRPIRRYGQLMKVVMGLVVVAMLLVPPVAAWANPSATLGISPETVTVHPGAFFEVKVLIKGDIPLRTAQCSLKFDPSLLEVESVVEGDFFKTWASANNCATLVFPEPAIDNASGVVASTGVAIMGLTEGGPSGEGSLFIYKMKAKAGAKGRAALTLDQVVVGDPDDQELSGVVVKGGEVVVSDTAPVPPGSEAKVAGPTVGVAQGSGGVQGVPAPAPASAGGPAVTANGASQVAGGSVVKPSVVKSDAAPAPARVQSGLWVPWELLGGVIGVVVVAGGVVYILRRPA
ncbi:MAG: cohesin domain-containing protein [Chloroflexota bacterium]